ncbi:MAG: hypothetical protein EOO75_09320, partial [Myxococcales bacterium]
LPMTTGPRPTPSPGPLVALVLSALWLGGCSAPVAAALTEDDANRVMQALGQAGIPGEKEVDPTSEGRYRVLVHRDEAGRAVTVLRDEELPPRSTPGVLESVGKSSLVPSAAVEHAQYLAGLAGDLERTLGSIDGVITARVHLSAQTRGPLDREPARATASVLLKHRGANSPVEPAAVQQLVAGALAGLTPGDVAVVLVARMSQAPAPSAALVSLGPVTVTRGTAGALRVMLGAVLGALGLGAVGLLLLWQRWRQAVAALAAAPGAP